MWNPRTSDYGTCTHIEKNKTKCGRPKKSQGIGAGQNLFSLLTTSYVCLSPSKTVPKAVQQCISHVVGKRIKQSQM